MRTAATGANACGARRALQESMPSSAARHTCCSCALLAGTAGRARCADTAQDPQRTARAAAAAPLAPLQRGLRAEVSALGISSARRAL